MRVIRFSLVGPVALLAALSLVTPACGGKDDKGEATEGGGEGGGEGAGGGEGGEVDAGSGDEFQDAVVDVSSLLISEGDGQALTADGLRASLTDARDYVNALLQAAMGNLGEIAVEANVTEFGKDKLKFRQWQAMGRDSVTEYQFNVVRIAPKVYAYGLRARQGEDAFVRVLWGAFAKKAPRRGAGRIHANFTAWKGVKADLKHDGHAEFRFLNHGETKVVAFGAKELVTPRNEDPLNGVIQYWKGATGKRAFRYVQQKDVVGGDAKEWVGVRAIYKLGTGGFMHALLTGGDVPEDNDPVTARGCWKEGEWVFLTSNPEGLFDNATGEAGDCLDQFKNAEGEPPDPTAPAADLRGDWDKAADFGIDALPSEADASQGEEDPADE
jgi:hypothetical protein